jgi:hypothetical protein
MPEIPKPMKSRQREAVLAELAHGLWRHDSWCGETHLQKASFLLEALCGVPLGLNHILYKYGPYSAALSDELVVMKADGLLEALAVRGYGPRLQPTPAAKAQLAARWPRTLKRYAAAIEFVASRVGARGVAELERLATAVWVRRELPEAAERDQALRVVEIKPHVSLDEAVAAIATASSWEVEARKAAPAAPRGSQRRSPRTASGSSVRT